MDSRAKQRLTGAVILVALFVLLVPELLTGPRVTDAPEGSPTDEGMRRYTIDLDASAPSAPHDNAAAQPPVALPPVADDRAQPGEAATPAAHAAPESAAPAPATAVAPRSEPLKPHVPSQPVPVQTAPTSAATPAPSQAPPPAARGSFAVQLGTFGNRENADRLVRDMNAKGFAAFVAPYTKENHELYRVRVGPARDRAAAEALAAQLRRIGQSGSIVPIS